MSFQTWLSSTDDLAQFLEAAVQKPGDGRIRPVQTAGGFGKRAALQMMQQKGAALCRWQLRKGVGRSEKIFMAHGALVGRRVGRGKHEFEPSRRLFNRLGEALFKADVALPLPQCAPGVA